MTKPQEYELTYASASLVLSGKNLDPHEVTRKLGMIPSESFKRGDYRTDTEIWSRGFWELSSRNLGNIDMRDHVFHDDRGAGTVDICTGGTPVTPGKGLECGQLCQRKFIR